jgi:hypothetical protein
MVFIRVLLRSVRLPSQLRLQDVRAAASAAQAGMAAPSQAQADPDRLTRTADLDG